MVGLCRAAGLTSSPFLGFNAIYQPKNNQTVSTGKACWKQSSIIVISYFDCWHTTNRGGAFRQYRDSHELNR